MYDINRPLRRLEVAQRIQELRDKAATAERDAFDAAAEAAALPQETAPSEPAPSEPAPVQTAPVQTAPVQTAPVQPSPELPAPRAHVENIVASVAPESSGFPDSADESAAATIASLLRGGQTWMLNPDERAPRPSREP